METFHLLHFGTVALTVALTALGVGLGQGLTSLVALEALDTQPHARAEISKTFILGMALY
ncbi:MAG: ATP synthase F0 subunit C [Candidatus Babeliales bacterium]|jgi:F0F1-type ATP synthase membrane subunit c/vacuolar-type H+-ATPase subunit K